MALVSPGVEVTIIDQSQYLPAASNSVPLLVVATAQNKLNAAGTDVATATTAANAGKLYQITTQRDLINLYGNPFFYKTTNGTPIQGYELNEYGLLAAYSLMGITNNCYVLRADIDLASLVGQVGRPTGAPADGTYWLDTTSSTWGIYEFNQTTGKFTNKIPRVLTESAFFNGTFPLTSIGNIGDYAIDSRWKSISDPMNDGQYFYKTSANEWVKLGSYEWLNSMPTVLGTGDPRVFDGVTGDLTQTQVNRIQGSIMLIDVNGEYNVQVTITGSTVQDIANDINDLNLGYLSADTYQDRYLRVFSSSPFGETYLQFSADPYDGTVDVENPSGETILDYLGIDTTKNYYQPGLKYGSSAEMPLWTKSQQNPRPTGSVWLKTSSAGNGMNFLISEYTNAAGAFVSKNVKVYGGITQASYELDPAGGAAIPAGTVIGEYLTAVDTPGSPFYFYERRATGPTIVTGTVNNPTFSVGATFSVRLSQPNSTALLGPYTVTLTGTTVQDFATAWQAAAIPNTSAIVTPTNAIQLQHDLGGDILLNVPGNNTVQAVFTAAGLIPDATDGILRFNVGRIQNTAAAVTSGVRPGGVFAGEGATFSIFADGKTYNIDGVTNGGSGYKVGDILVISGTQLAGTTPTNDLVLLVTELQSGTITGGTNIEIGGTTINVGGTGSIRNSGGAIGVGYVQGNSNLGYWLGASNWRRLEYTANEGAPTTAPLNNTNWFFSVVDQIDIMIQKDGQWKGYRNTPYDEYGNPAYAGSNLTDVGGIIYSATPPELQSDASSPLQFGDLWLDTSDLENYPVLSRWQKVDGVDQWILIDNTDQTSGDGILFADARWAGAGDVHPANDPIPTIKSLLTSNYVDLDAPNPDLYPQGMLLFNTRRSGYNVKKYRVGYFAAKNWPDQNIPLIADAWVSASGTKDNGHAYLGRKAQRNMVTQAMKAAVQTSMAIREEDTFMNLMAAPGYPELMPELVGLNNERNNTAYIIGDTPLRLNDQATDITAWAQNKNNASATGEDGLVTRNEYMGIFYPSGISTDLSGASVVVPASHMILRTFLRNDQIAYPWLAAAGTRRGTIDNATNIGFIDAVTGEFQVVKNRVGIRDVLYSNQINPLAFFTGVGLLNYGNKNSKDTQSALDRTNVARLVAYIRERLQVVARPFIFEPNDALTRTQLSGVVQTLFVDLVAKRGLYDYLVVCDSTNNTPARIDRNELWVDIAIEPVKAAEFIYIPVRILNTGEIAALGTNVFA
jgi:hypothetical protein